MSKKSKRFQCTDCGHRFNAKPSRHNNTSRWGDIARSQGGFTVDCWNCGREMVFDENGNPTISEEIRNFFRNLFG